MINHVNTIQSQIQIQATHIKSYRITYFKYMWVHVLLSKSVGVNQLQRHGSPHKCEPKTQTHTMKQIRTSR